MSLFLVGTARTVSAVVISVVLSAPVGADDAEAPARSSPGTSASSQGASGAGKASGGQHDMHKGHSMSMQCEGMEDCSRQMHQMHLSMLKSGNVDRNFAEMMAKHHEHGIEMARAQLASGKDPEMRKFAQRIVDAQQKERAELQAWLKRSRGGSSSQSSSSGGTGSR